MHLNEPNIYSPPCSLLTHILYHMQFFKTFPFFSLFLIFPFSPDVPFSFPTTQRTVQTLYLSAFARSRIIKSTVSLSTVYIVTWKFCTIFLIKICQYFPTHSVCFISSVYVPPGSLHCRRPPRAWNRFCQTPPAPCPSAPPPHGYGSPESPDSHMSDHNFSFHRYFSFFQTFSHSSIK